MRGAGQWAGLAKIIHNSGTVHLGVTVMKRKDVPGDGIQCWVSVSGPSGWGDRCGQQKITHNSETVHLGATLMKCKNVRGLWF